MPALLGRARLAVPVTVRHRRRGVPHRPLQESVSAGEAAAGADPGRSRSGAAVAAGHSAAGIGGRDSAELTALADHLTAHGMAPDLLAESLRGAVLKLADGSPGR